MNAIVNTLANATSIVLVSRHPGAIEWLSTRYEAKPEQQVSRTGHLTDKDLAAAPVGTAFLGIFPIGLALKIKEHGHVPVLLELEFIPAEWRGIDLTVEQMAQCGPTLSLYRIELVARW